MTESGPYRDGKVHVLSRMCDTCIFRPGNRMHLEEGRVEGMVREATDNNSTVVCHSTIHRHDGVQPACCRGFYDRHATPTLQIAERMGVVVEVEPPT